MAAYVSNIVVDVGANFDQSFNLETNANAPLNLTGYTGAAKLKKSAATSKTAADFVVSFPDPLQGQLKISLGSTITAGLKPGRYVYDVLLTDTSSMKSRVVEGSAIVTAGITT
jgi:hypothetical protein|tara:strand:+ start:96 stop:434 length:339 start_codon:yes stop_codon:yes gene_type:complete